MELTRAYTTAATTTYRFLELGLATALLYFLMSFPLSLWSRHMEKKQIVNHG
jgi:polar amino acid transport system substrate-binding protein